MEETDAGKEWFVTREGKQFGPVSMEDLKFEVGRGELNPRLDKVWKNGMDEWIPAGELDGLFEKNDEAKAAEKEKEEKQAKNFTKYESGDTQEEIERAKVKHPGAGRGSFFFFCYLFPAIWSVGMAIGLPLMQAKVSPFLLKLAIILYVLAPLILAISATLQRFQNLGMTRKWVIGLFVPLLNIWVYYRLFACPPGYAETKKLDPIGWVLAILYWLPTLIITAAFAVLIYVSASDPDKFKEWIPEEDFRKYSESMEKALKSAEEKVSPKKEEKPKPEPIIRRG